MLTYAPERQTTHLMARGLYFPWNIKKGFTLCCLKPTIILSKMDTRWPSERKIRKYERLGDYSVEPYGEKHYALYKGDLLICVTVYKKGALEIMRRLSEMESKIFERKEE
jgi:hypothetical protein